jgi:hypothetical protein
VTNVSSSNYNFYAEGNAPNYFAGLTEHTNGVKVTGGSSGTVNRGIYYSDGKIRIVQQSEADGDSFSACASYPTFGHNVNSIIGFEALPPGRNPTTVLAEEYKGFSVPETTQNIITSTGTLYGFHSDLAGQGTRKYNFYAASSDLIRFRGNTGIGNLPSNTNIGQGGELTFVGGDNPRIYSSITSNTTPNSFVSSVSNNTGDRTMMTFSQGNLNAPPSLIGLISHDGAEVTYSKNSDYRLKTNVQPLTNASALLAQLNPVTFEYNNKLGTTYQGFIAHELQQVDSKFATGTKDETEAIGTLTDVDGAVTADVPQPEVMPYGETWVQTGTRPVYQGVDQTKLIPLLTKALQEALERIETLEADVASLQNP